MLLDVPGLLLGHHSAGDTGVTAILSQHKRGMIGGVDVRGGGPGTRETDLLAAHNTVERVHAVILAGGSAFGLAAADGAMRALESEGYGFAVFGEDRPGPRVPIVPAAVIFDLIIGSPDNRPDAKSGAAAVHAALSGESTGSGNVGAGCGATAGKLRSGFGQASLRVGQYTVGAGIVANPVGDVINLRTGKLHARPEAPGVNPAEYVNLETPLSKLNTTIGVVATDAPITAAQATRLAMTSHDGIARAVQPAHSPLDGDTLFGLGTNESAAGVDIETLSALCAAGAQLVAEAIVDAVSSAVEGYGWRTLRGLS